MVFLGRSGAYIPPESCRNLRSAPKSGGYGSIVFLNGTIVHFVSNVIICQPIM